MNLPDARSVLVVALMLFVSGCWWGDEARIRELLAEGVARAQRHDVEGVLALATDDLRAQPGNRDRAGVAEGLTGAFYYYGRFRILYPEAGLEVAEGGQRAEVTMPFLIARHGQDLRDLAELRGDPAAWLARVGDSADLYHLNLELVKAVGGWRVHRADLRSRHRPGLQP